jgi:hypothetical protein
MLMMHQLALYKCQARLHDPDLTTKSPTHLPSREQFRTPEATAGMRWSLHWDPENAIIPFFLELVATIATVKSQVDSLLKLEAYF